MFTEQLQYINPPSNITNKLNHADILELVGFIVALTAIRSMCSELYLNHWKWSNYGLSSNTSIKLHIVTGFC